MYIWECTYVCVWYLNMCAHTYIQIQLNHKNFSIYIYIYMERIKFCFVSLIRLYISHRGIVI